VTAGETALFEPNGKEKEMIPKKGDLTFENNGQYKALVIWDADVEAQDFANVRLASPADLASMGLVTQAEYDALQAKCDLQHDKLARLFATIMADRDELEKYKSQDEPAPAEPAETPQPVFEVGDNVRVIRGTLTGDVGRVVRVHPNGWIEATRGRGVFQFMCRAADLKLISKAEKLQPPKIDCLVSLAPGKPETGLTVRLKFNIGDEVKLKRGNLRHVIDHILISAGGVSYSAQETYYNEDQLEPWVGKPQPVFEVGDKVRVIVGTLAGNEGRVLRVHSNGWIEAVRETEVSQFMCGPSDLELISKAEKPQPHVWKVGDYAVYQMPDVILRVVSIEQEKQGEMLHFHTGYQAYSSLCTPVPKPPMPEISGAWKLNDNGYISYRQGTEMSLEAWLSVFQIDKAEWEDTAAPQMLIAIRDWRILVDWKEGDEV